MQGIPREEKKKISITKNLDKIRKVLRQAPLKSKKKQQSGHKRRRIKTIKDKKRPKLDDLMDIEEEKEGEGKG